MEIEDVQCARARQREVGAKAAARLPPAHRQVVVDLPQDRQPAQDGVAVAAAAFEDVGHEGEAGTRLLGDRPRLVQRRDATVDLADLLERGDLGRELAQHAGDAAQIEPSVGPDTAVDVPGEERELVGHRQGAARGGRGAIRRGEKY
jgi:hypothetical protein